MERMPTQDEILQSRIYMIKKEPRHLDKAPSKFKVSTIGFQKVYGIAETFAEVYNSVYVKIDNTKDCKVILNTSEAVVDKVPFACLKTLIMMNINTDPELSKTCVVLFQKILEKTSRQSIDGIVHITTDAFHDTLMNMRVSTVYASSLIKGIFLCAYPKDYRARVWNDLLDVSSDRYQNLREIGVQYLEQHPELEIEEDIRTALNKAYKDALKVKGFCSKLAKDLSHEAIGMVFLTFMNNPEVFTEFDKTSMITEDVANGN